MYQPRCAMSAESLEPRRLLAATAAIDGAAAAHGDRTVDVMTQNLYLGGNLDPVSAAMISGNPSAIVGAVSTLWASIVANDFNTRAAAIADEIGQARPALVGLQEAELYRTGRALSPEPADHVEYDYVQILLDRLAERGLHYAAAATSINFDAEAPGFTAPGVLRDIRITDRDVILARTDLPASELQLSNAATGDFSTIVRFPIGSTGQFVNLSRGWAQVDATVRGQTFRFVTTHLEPNSRAVQEAQADELLAGAADTELPVVMAGDFNSAAAGSDPRFQTASYAKFRAAGFADVWSRVRPGEDGFTADQAGNLRNATSELSDRIDLVLTRGAIAPRSADLLGEDPADRTPSGLWPSDHAGLAATLDVLVAAAPFPVPDAGNNFIVSSAASTPTVLGRGDPSGRDLLGVGGEAPQGTQDVFLG